MTNTKESKPSQKHHKLQRQQEKRKGTKAPQNCQGKIKKLSIYKSIITLNIIDYIIQLKSIQRD